MAKQPLKHSPYASLNMPGGLPGMTMFNGKLAESYTRAGQAFVANAFKFNQEILRFATERFQADIQAMESFSRCKNWSEVASCQTDYTRLAAEAYEKEVTKLAELGNDATNEALEPLRDAVEKISEVEAQT